VLIPLDEPDFDLLPLSENGKAFKEQKEREKSNDKVTV
tara:strand:- start:413 stop:526 length:114 start_codon:yes stop_codon:yes gene_type:complete